MAFHVGHLKPPGRDGLFLCLQYGSWIRATP